VLTDGQADKTRRDNAHDEDMPAFGSLPGMKMMATKGTGWAAREISIDGNAPLAWMAWWAEHRASACLALDPLAPTNVTHRE